MRALVRSVVCERVRGQVSVLLDGELSQLEQRMVSAHLDRCADCRQFEADVRGFTEELRAAPPEVPRRPIVVRRTRRVSYSAVQISAAAMLLVGVLGLASQVGVSEQANRQTAQAARPDLFTTTWQPDVELAQISTTAETPAPEERPGPLPAL